MVASAAGAAGPAVRVSEVTLFGDMDCFRIETPSATYLYGKRGAGFASIIDPGGHDWISYRHGGKSAGEYRGLPKCGQPVKYFHCGYGYGRYRTDNPFTSTVTVSEPGHVRIHSETLKGDAAGDWDFFPDRATFTLTKIPGGQYWFVYEGTPGGTLDVAEDFVVRPGGKKTPLTEPWKEVVPWTAFGAKESPQLLFLVNHQPGSPVDSYVSWPYKAAPDEPLNQMTVFGFGRPDWQDPRQHTPSLTGLPARFTVALAEAADGPAVSATAEKLVALVQTGGLGGTRPPDAFSPAEIAPTRPEAGFHLANDAMECRVAAPRPARGLEPVETAGRRTDPDLLHRYGLDNAPTPRQTFSP